MKTTAQKIDEIRLELEKLQAAGCTIPENGSCRINGVFVVWDMPAGAPQDAAGIAAHTVRPKLMQALAAYGQELNYMLADLERKLAHEDDSNNA